MQVLPVCTTLFVRQEDGNRCGVMVVAAMAAVTYMLESIPMDSQLDLAGRLPFSDQAVHIRSLLHRACGDDARDLEGTAFVLATQDARHAATSDAPHP